MATKNQPSKPVMSTSSNMTFEDGEEINFPDGTQANFGEIALRSLRLRPQRSDAGELWCVLTATFLVDDIIASKGDDVHTLTDLDNAYGKAYQEDTLKRIETERWIPWNRVSSLKPLFLQLQNADYEVESNKFSYSQVKKWFAEHEKATTMSPESTWMDFSVKRDHEPLPASFIAGISEMQEGVTQSVYAGLDEVKALIDNFTEAHSSGDLTNDMKQDFRALVGNVLGFHETRKGAKWGNKMALTALTVNDEEYSLFFDRNREKVTDIESMFDEDDDEATAEEQEEPIDIGKILDVSDIED